MAAPKALVWGVAVPVLCLAIYSFRAAKTGSHGTMVDFGLVSATNSFPKGQCTWYAFERALDDGHRLKFSQSYGRDARRWPVLSSGQLLQDPVPGSLMILDAWVSNPYGHVALVETVADAKHWTISHANMNVGEEFGIMDGVKIRRVGCERQSDGSMSFAGFRTHFRMLGFLIPR